MTWVDAIVFVAVFSMFWPQLYRVAVILLLAKIAGIL